MAGKDFLLTSLSLSDMAFQVLLYVDVIFCTAFIIIATIRKLLWFLLLQMLLGTILNVFWKTAK